MFKLAGIFRDQNEEYLVVPVIQKFLKRIGVKVEAPWTKADLLTKIENYANSSAEASEYVNDWLDDTLCEGIKEIQIEHRTLKNEMELLFTSEAKIGTYLDSYLSSGLMHHICGNEYDATQYQFVKYSISTGARGQVIRMIFCKKMHFSENKTGVVTTKPIEYPIIAEYYMEHAWLCIRFKMRSGLYHYKESGYDTTSVRVSVSQEIQNVLKKVDSLLGLEVLTAEQNAAQIRRKLFVLLDRYTHTPSPILKAMDIQKEYIDNVVSQVMSVCNLPIGVHNNVREDINNLVEKYFSVYWPKPEIFTQDRDAFPIHLSAKDEESSQVDQRAGFNQPLQSRAVFFDNKRMLYQQKSCESIQFFWKKISPVNLQDEFFPVRIYEERGRCRFKFSKYTIEEDIQNVLFSIIEAV